MAPDKLYIKVFTRQPTEQEIQELLETSGKVRHLTLPQRFLPWEGESARTAEFIRVDSDVYSLLHHTAGNAGRILFPNLASIVVMEPSPELETLSEHFGPELADVDVILNLRLETNSIWINDLWRHNPGIRSVKIEIAPLDILGDTIRSLSQLERLETKSVLAVESLRHLGGLNTFQSLSFVYDPSHQPSDWLGPRAFQHLRSLTCQFKKFDDAILLLCNISHFSLTHLEIELACYDDDTRSNAVNDHDLFSTWWDAPNAHYNDFPSSLSTEQKEPNQKWFKLMQAVSSNVKCSSLVSLRIRELTSWYYRTSPLTFDSIEPLLVYKNLMELEIKAAGGVYVDQRSIANCMPKLKSMVITSPPIV